MSDSKQQAEEFKALVEAKIKRLVSDFAEGKISREQFHLLYARYNSRLAITDHALLSGNPDAVQIAQTGPPTMVIKDATMGKVVGILIYHNMSSKTLETLGDFNLPFSLLEPILDDFTLRMVTRQLAAPRMEKIGKTHWVLFNAGQFVTVVTLFINEPSQMQIRELDRLLHDFEQANHPELIRPQINVDKLAYPFMAFIKKKFGKSS
ncbi:MAG: hypothetical protein D6711_02875 [Chloroflexi bacterium]|nr:MAG: hypothetical protein D6711_02875 [Chloroflexota bacterium]